MNYPVYISNKWAGKQRWNQSVSFIIPVRGVDCDVQYHNTKHDGIKESYLISHTVLS
jgi:hypothetical protein